MAVVFVVVDCSLKLHPRIRLLLSGFATNQIVTGPGLKGSFMFDRSYRPEYCGPFERLIPDDLDQGIQVRAQLVEGCSRTRPGRVGLGKVRPVRME